MKGRRIWVGGLCVLVLLIAGLMLGGQREPESSAETTIHGVRQFAASSTAVSLSWEGAAEKYILVQCTSSGKEVGVLGNKVTSPVTIQSLLPGGRYYFRVYEADADGKKKSKDDPGVFISDVRTLPKKQATPKLAYWYRASDEADFTWAADSQVDGYKIRVEKADGKKLASKVVTGSAVSGASTVLGTIRPCYRGRVARVRVCGFIRLNGVKRFGEEWSEPAYFASAKKIKLSGAKDTIRVSGVRVKDAVKKEIYVSCKKKKGFEKAKTLGENETSCSFSKYGKKLISSGINGKTYYVRVYYYYKVNGKEQKSPVYDEGSVYVKPTYFDIEVGA